MCYMLKQIAREIMDNSVNDPESTELSYGKSKVRLHFMKKLQKNIKLNCKNNYLKISGREKLEVWD